MDQTANEGDTASFICQADGEPVPTISWYLNSAPLSETNTSKYMITERQMQNYSTDTLTILSVESSDVGTYTCNATNVVASDTGSAVLTINGELFKLMLLIVNYF